METKQKTLAECKQIIIEKHGMKTWEVVMKMHPPEVWLKWLDEAAELYAGHTKQSDSPCLIFVPKTDTSSATICQNCGREKFTHFQEHQSPEKWQPIEQSSPVSLEVEEAAEKANGYSVYAKGSEKYHAFNDGFIAGAKWQSQQPASVAFLSEEEIVKLGTSKKYYTAIEAMTDIQSELRKRVIDPVEFFKWANTHHVLHPDGWQLRITHKEADLEILSTQQLLKDYIDNLTSKTK